MWTRLEATPCWYSCISARHNVRGTCRTNCEWAYCALSRQRATALLNKLVVKGWCVVFLLLCLLLDPAVCLGAVSAGNKTWLYNLQLCAPVAVFSR